MQSVAELKRLRTLRQTLLAVICGGLLSVGFLEAEYYFFAWIAFIPLLFASNHAGVLKTYWLGVVSGFTAFAVATYWVADFIEASKGYNETNSVLLASLVWLYCAHSVALTLLLFRWLRRWSAAHDFLLFPMIVVVVNASFPMIFSMKLGESQVGFPQALQAVAFTGVYGLSFLIALVNIVLWRLLTRACQAWGVLDNARAECPRSNASPWAYILALSAIGVWFVYGTQRVVEIEEQVAQWNSLKVGLVQPNERPTLGKTALTSGYSRAYPPELEMTERLSVAGADLVIWPEGSTKYALDNAVVQQAYQKAVSDFEVGLLFQDTEHGYDSVSGRLNYQYNSAVMMTTERSKQEPQVYRKVKRIPLGEYLPVFSDSSLLRPWAEDFIGDFLSEISSGKKHEVFTYQGIHLIPLICYETTFPSFVAAAANHAYNKTPKSEPKVLVALTNDGWFGKTHQPLIHVYGSIMRAVEQGLTLVHVANNGPSIVVSPNGKILFQTALNDRGGYLTDVPYSASAGNTFYSRFPAFKMLMQILFGALLIRAFYNRRRTSK